MDNIQDALMALRLQNQQPFQPADVQQGMPPGTPEPQSQDIYPQASEPEPTLADIVSHIFSQYHPQTRARDALMDALTNFPQRQEPSTGRKVLGAIAAFGAGAHPVGISMGQPVGFEGGTPQEKNLARDTAEYPNFNRQLTDWNLKAKPLEVAANDERAFNANERQNINNDALRATMAYDKMSLAKRRDEQTALGEDANEIRRSEAATKDYLAKHPNATFEQNETGYVIGVDPKTLKAEIITDPTTGKPLHKLSETAKQQNALQAAQKRAETVADAGVKRVKIAAKYRNWQQITDKDTGEVYLMEPGTNHAIKPTAEMIETHENQDNLPGATPTSTPTPTPTGKTTPTPTPTGTPPVKQPTFVSKTNQLKQPVNLAAIRANTQETLGALSELLDDDNKLRPEVGKYVGLGRASGFLEKYIPGAEARTAQAKMDRLKNLLTINLIGEMKAQSRTGATGFGQLSSRELDVLEKGASKLDPGIEKQAFESELVRIKNKLRLILMDPGGADIKRTPDELIEMYRKDKK